MGMPQQATNRATLSAANSTFLRVSRAWLLKSTGGLVHYDNRDLVYASGYDSLSQNDRLNLQLTVASWRIDSHVFVT